MANRTELLSEESYLLHEMERRNNARSSLAEYGLYLNPYCLFPDIHLEMIDLLEKVERGEIKRLIINMPPRFGKSWWVSQFFPAWYLSRNPRRKIIHASYSADIAVDFGREIRNIFNSEEHAQLFEVRLRQDSKSAKRFHSTNGGHYYAAGARGSITGKGCHLGIIEDPTNANDMDNVSIHNKCVSWFKGTFRSRLEPNAAIVIVQQRLHTQDLSGQLIQEMEEGGEKWVVLTIPAVDENGHSNFPERWSDEELEQIKLSVSFKNPRVWTAQYLQNPKEGEGDLFKAAWFKDKYVDPEEVPENLVMARGWDRAATEAAPGKNPDYSAGVKIGRTKEGRVYILHAIRFRKSPFENEILTADIAKQDGRKVKIYQEEEPGSSGKTTTSHYQRNVLSGYSFKGVKSSGSKVERAGPASAQCEAGNVFIVRGNWNADFISELITFPNGKNDDFVDGFSLVYNCLVEKPNYIRKLGKK